MLKGAANNIQEIIAIEPDNVENEIELQLEKYTRVVNDVLTIGTADMCEPLPETSTVKVS